MANVKFSDPKKGEWYGGMQFLCNLGKIKSYTHEEYYAVKCFCGMVWEMKKSQFRKKTEQCSTCVSRYKSLRKKDLYISSVFAGFDIHQLKIGSTNNPENKFRMLKQHAAGPSEILLHAVNKGHLEKFLHISMVEHHHHGEWFIKPKNFSKSMVNHHMKKAEKLKIEYEKLLGRR